MKLLLWPFFSLLPIQEGLSVTRKGDKVLDKHLVKLASENSVVRQTDSPNIAVDWDVKHQTKQTILTRNV